MKLAQLKDGRVLTAAPSSADVEMPDVIISMLSDMHADEYSDKLELTWYEARDLRDMLDACLKGAKP